MAPLAATIALLAAAAEPEAPQPSEDKLPPSITHIPPKEIAAGEPARFEVEILDESRIFEPRITWRFKRSQGEWRNLPLERVGGDRFIAQLSAELVTGDIEYYVEAYDELGNGPGRSGVPQKPHLLHVAGLAAEVSAPAAAAALPAPAVAEPPVESPSMLGPYLVMGGGAALAIAGTLLWLGASSDASELNARYSARGASMSPSDHERALGLTTRARIGSALLAAGVLGLAGGAGWFAAGPLAVSVGGTF